jgi:hypothetical protein
MVELRESDRSQVRGELDQAIVVTPNMSVYILTDTGDLPDHQIPIISTLTSLQLQHLCEESMFVS